MNLDSAVRLHHGSRRNSNNRNECEDARGTTPLPRREGARGGSSARNKNPRRTLPRQEGGVSTAAYAISAALCALACLAACNVALADDIVIPPIPPADEIANAPTFHRTDKVVATHYFYWYRWPDEHFFDDTQRTDDALRHHFPNQRDVSYESAAWHRKQMQDMQAAGIDVALCVYWGTPNNYDSPAVRFSVAGLPPLVQALDELAKNGTPPRIGLFYDTSTLLGHHAFPDTNRGNVDLRTDEGKDVFYRTIRDFFCLVPPRHWACVDDRPIVQLYGSSFAAAHDQGFIDYVYEHFARDFAGRKPYIIAGPSWHVRADARVGWGAALNGPILTDSVAQVGPGYDDSPVPGRTTPTRDRLGGGYYSASWLLAIQREPWLVIIETWSELHEGTGICETVEDGRFYVDLTRHFSDLFKAGGEIGDDDWAAALRAVLDAPRSQAEGREFASRLSLEMKVERADAAANTAAQRNSTKRPREQTSSNAGHGELRVVNNGVRLILGAGDGPFDVTEIAGVPCVQTRKSVSEWRYLYFDVADPYYYDHRGELTVTVTYLDTGTDPILLQYDSADPGGDIAARYKEHPVRIARKNTDEWRTATLRLPHARCANRQNAGADFRLATPNSELAVKSVEVRKLPADYAESRG